MGDVERSEDYTELDDVLHELAGRHVDPPGGEGLVALDVELPTRAPHETCISAGTSRKLESNLVAYARAVGRIAEAALQRGFVDPPGVVLPAARPGPYAAGRCAPFRTIVVG